MIQSNTPTVDEKRIPALVCAAITIGSKEPFRAVTISKVWRAAFSSRCAARTSHKLVQSAIYSFMCKVKFKVRLTTFPFYQWKFGERQDFHLFHPPAAVCVPLVASEQEIRWELQEVSLLDAMKKRKKQHQKNVRTQTGEILALGCLTSWPTDVKIGKHRPIFADTFF